MPTFHKTLATVSLFAAAAATAFAATPKASREDKAVQAEHVMIGAGGSDIAAASEHTQHPDAQWYPDAGLGLFLHYSICSVRAMNISWPMIPGRALETKRIDDPAERERIIKEGDWDLKGHPPAITPNEYWSMAKEFNPQDYNPDKWLKAAKDAGFTYVVLTTRHHDGFALWPSKYGDFSTSNYMGGKDLVKDYVEACHKNGLKVGLYYSPPNWYFDREYMNFLYHNSKNNPEFPALDADLKPRTSKHTPEEIKKHQQEFAELERGQIEELLSNYGKIDLIWFDGKPPIPNPSDVITQDRIRELQPGIVINPRLHGHGDFLTYERTLKTDKISPVWAEYCNTWNATWSYTKSPYKSDGYVLVQLARCRSLGINYLLGIGPMASGDLAPEAYENMAVVAGWMKTNGVAIHGARPLPSAETASVPATASGQTRYLFALPEFKAGGTSDEDLVPPSDSDFVLKGLATKPQAVRLLADGTALSSDFTAGKLTVHLPAAKRSKLVDVIAIELSSGAVGG